MCHAVLGKKVSIVETKQLNGTNKDNDPTLTRKLKIHALIYYNVFTLFLLNFFFKNINLIIIFYFKMFLLEKNRHTEKRRYNDYTFQKLTAKGTFPFN